MHSIVYIKNVIAEFGIHPCPKLDFFWQKRVNGCARLLVLNNELGFKLYATGGTAEFIRSNGINSEILHWPLDNEEPNTLSYITEGKIDLVINIPKNIEKEELDNDYLIRRKAVDFDVPLITNVQIAKRFVEALYQTSVEELKVKAWDEYN